MSMQPLTMSAINLLLQDVINKVLNWKPEEARVQVETQTGTRPANAPYVTLWWRRVDPLMQTIGTFVMPDDPKDDAVEHLRNESLCEIQITARGPQALAYAAQIRFALESAARQFDLYKVIGFAGCTEIQVFSAPYNGAIQQRAMFNLSFYAMFNREFPADWFDASQWQINGAETQLPREDPVCP